MTKKLIFIFTLITISFYLFSAVNLVKPKKIPGFKILYNDSIVYSTYDSLLRNETMVIEKSSIAKTDTLKIINISELWCGNTPYVEIKNPTETVYSKMFSYKVPVIELTEDLDYYNNQFNVYYGEYCKDRKGRIIEGNLILNHIFTIFIKDV